VFAQYYLSLVLIRKKRVPFIAYRRFDFFSLTRYTFPTSPLPSNFIFSKLEGPTSTLRTLIELEEYVRRNGAGLPNRPGLSCSRIGGVRYPFCFPSVPADNDSAVGGRVVARGDILRESTFGVDPFVLSGPSNPCAFGADATRRSWRLKAEDGERGGVFVRTGCTVLA